MHTSIVCIFNILPLKIVRSTDIEGRQSNKESAIRRGGNEKGLSFCYLQKPFLLLLLSLLVQK